MHEDEFSQEEWDRAKIVKGIILLLVFGGLVFYSFRTRLLSLNLQKNTPALTSDSGQVKGSRTENSQGSSVSVPGSRTENSQGSSVSIPLSIQSSLDDKIVQIKQEVSNLNIDQVASSSPQVQKILQDVKSLKQYPRNQAKETCLNICDSL